MRLTLKTLLVSLLVALALVGCGSSQTGGTSTSVSPSPLGAQTVFPVTIDSCSQSLTFDQPVKRIFTMGGDPAIAVVAAGGASRIIARAYDGGEPLGPYASALVGIPDISPNDMPSVESVIAQRPDLVVSFELTSNADFASRLAQTGIKVLVPNWRCNTGTVTFADVYQQIDALGQALGTRASAEATITKLKSRQEAVEQRFSGTTPRTAAVVYVAQNSIAAYGKRSFDNTVIQALGLRNVFGDVDKRLFSTNPETLINKNPDVIIATYDSFTADQQALQAFQSQPGVDKLTAVQEGHVIPLGHTYLVGGPLTVDGLEKIGTALTAFK